MTVGELVEALKGYGEDTPVVIGNDVVEYLNAISGVHPIAAYRYVNGEGYNKQEYVVSLEMDEEASHSSCGS